jgi:hypothetical protein
MDIAGFKSMMGDKRAALALDAFYSAGYSILHEHRDDDVLVHGFFISDCGILFVRGEQRPAAVRLESLCRIIQQIHQKTFKKAFHLTTSVAWGEFSYHERIEFPGIQKNPIYGNAYVAAYTDNEGLPKLYASECRIRRADLPVDVVQSCVSGVQPFFNLMRETPEHFYYEWMRRLTFHN